MIDHLLSRPLVLGEVVFPNRVFGAPMAGVTDLPFRRRVVAHGAGASFSEMSATAHIRGSTSSARRSAVAGVPHVVQLAGRSATDLAEAARIAEAEGAEVIDINMGCPAKKVTGGYAGSALLREPGLALSIIETVARAVSVPVTVKTRLAWDEGQDSAIPLVERLETAGARMLTLHARTRCQFYNGRADWAAIAPLRAATRLPVVANGDIASLADAERALALSGADAVMIGRAQYGAPWIVGEIARQAGASMGLCSVPPGDRAGYVLAHHDDMLAFYGTERGLRHARKHIGWYLSTFGVDLGDLDRLALMECQDVDRVRDLIAGAFRMDERIGEAA